MKTKSKTTTYIVHSIAAAVLVLIAQISLAGNATWLLSPQDSAWEDANNWTPGGPPNGPSDIATFAQSSQTNVNISTSVGVHSIVFTAGSASFHLGIPAPFESTAGQLIISGTGVHNNSSVSQSFGVGEGGRLIFNNAATAASAHMHIGNSGALLGLSSTPGETIFNDTSSAAGASISNGGSDSGLRSGHTIFNDASTGDHASITNGGGQPFHGGGDGGYTSFNDTSTAGHATITNEGGDPTGGRTIFNDSSTAGSAILLANGAGIYGEGGAIFFSRASTGGTAQVKVFDLGYLDISGHNGGVTIGSIEGSGNVFLGANNLTVGTNNINTSFSGLIEGGGSLAKVGSGVLTFQANHCVADAIGLVLVSGSIIKLDFTGPPDAIASLVVNGVPQPPGVYGGPLSGAPNILPEFAGRGTVRVGCAAQGANLHGWGYNVAGQLGDGTTTNRVTPVAVDTSGALSGKTVTAVAAGNRHTVALTSGGKLFAWGWNHWGQLGDGTTINRITPVAVDMSGALSGKTVTAIAAGYAHAVALTSDGKVFAWGWNSDGQLGNGTTNITTTPVAVDMSGALRGKTVTAIAAGEAHTIALTSDGKVFAWGNNIYGKLGDGTTTRRTRPVAVDMSGALRGKRVTAIAAGGDHTVALTSDGKVFAWGYNAYGQLGNGTHNFLDNTTPVAVNMSGALRGKTVTAIAAGSSHTVALTSDGKVFAWGNNCCGQLGDGTTSFDRETPVAVDMSGALSGETVTAIAAGQAHTVALTSDGKVFAWGYNAYGQLGDGTFNSSTIPVAVNMSGALSCRSLTAIAASSSSYHTMALAVSRLSNISTRAFVQTGDNVMIGGFIVQGTEQKRVIIRAIGPELTQYGVPNALGNPSLELHDGTGALIASNDNWRDTIIGGIITSDQTSDIRNSGHAPGDGRESAIIADLAAGNYTAIVRGVNNTTGVALVEVYDLSPETNSILGNISTRSFVQTGDNVMVGGFIVHGTAPKRVIMRAIGPDLTQYGVPNALGNPTLELHDSTGALIASNDNWLHTIIGGIITIDQTQAIRNSGYAPKDGRESAIIADLPAGNYTAIVRGVNNSTGVALVEVYDLDQ